jgi:hypothetical protein
MEPDEITMPGDAISGVALQGRRTEASGDDVPTVSDLSVSRSPDAEATAAPVTQGGSGSRRQPRRPPTWSFAVVLGIAGVAVAWFVLARSPTQVQVVEPSAAVSAAPSPTPVRTEPSAAPTEGITSIYMLDAETPAQGTDVSNDKSPVAADSIMRRPTPRTPPAPRPRPTGNQSHEHLYKRE